MLYPAPHVIIPFSLELDGPSQVQSSIDRIVVERWSVLKLVIKTQPRQFANRPEETEVERANVSPRDGIIIELVIACVDVVTIRYPVVNEEVAS